MRIYTSNHTLYSHVRTVHNDHSYIHRLLLLVTTVVLPEITNFRDTLFSLNVPEAEAGTLSTDAILVIQKCQQTIDNFLLLRTSPAEGDGCNGSDVWIRVVQQFEQGIDYSG